MTTLAAEPAVLDPIEYEIFRHRLFNILEEGRITIRMVSGSAVVIEGGETICTFYTADGTPIIVASGILIQYISGQNFIKECIRMYGEDPGIFEGDQFFFNDPYLGGMHIADQIIVKPIYWEGELIAWTASFMHTPETGGLEPGGVHISATDIFAEGVRIPGLKIVEKGHFRPDVFNAISVPTRDPHLIGLDTKAKIAANNVCASQFLELVKSYGHGFVTSAAQRIISESEAAARERLRRLPNGTWRGRTYGDNNGIWPKPYRVVCRMTKQDDSLTFDYTGSSPQNEGPVNLAYIGGYGNLFVALAHLFWDLPWDGGMLRPIAYINPEGTVANCRYPGATSTGVGKTGQNVTQTAYEGVARMLYAGGVLEDVNSGWTSGSGLPYFGGRNQFGAPFAGVILDLFGAGCGATPTRDGVDTGGNMMNPSSTIADVEVLEQNLPIVYLYRRHAPDSGGFGRWAGGLGGEVALMVYGTSEMKMGYSGIGTKTPVAHGMFGGYPAGFTEQLIARNTNLRERLAAAQCPGSIEEFAELEGDVEYIPAVFKSVPVKEYDVLVFNFGGGGGYGDPLEREPERVAADFSRGAISLDTAARIYGVVLDGEGSVETEATRARREAIRSERRTAGRPLRDRDLPPEALGSPVVERVRIHESLEVLAKENGAKVIACRHCGYQFCSAADNYKLYACLREGHLDGVKRRSLLSGEKPYVLFQEYACPGCGTLLEVDNYQPDVDPPEERVLWDLAVEV